MRDYPGYNRFHPHSDDAIRGHEREGLKHIITRHGKPAAGYRAEQHPECSIKSPRDQKISYMPPVSMERYGVSEDAKGNGMIRNADDAENQRPRKGGMPQHGKVNTRGTR